MRAFLESLEEERRRRFRRTVWVSAALHGAVLLLVVVAPGPRTTTRLPGVVRVDLVAASAPPASGPPAAAPAPEPEPAPQPAPEPKPRPKPPEQVVLPEEPEPEPQPEPEPEPQPEPEPEPEPEPKPEPPPPAEPAEPEVGYEDVLAELREKEQDAQPEPSEGGAAGGETGSRHGPPGGAGVRVDPEVLAWMRDAKVHVTRAWVLPAGFRSEPLQAEIEVELGPGGEVRGTEVLRGSGNPWFDESAERAVRKASPLPAPPEPGSWAFVFEPGDAF